MTPEELRVNGGWSVKPELKEYVRVQAEKNNVSSSRYVENLIIADAELRNALGDPKIQAALQDGYKEMLKGGTTRKKPK